MVEYMLCMYGAPGSIPGISTQVFSTLDFLFSDPFLHKVSQTLTFCYEVIDALVIIDESTHLGP